MANRAAGVIINAVTPSKYGIDANGGAFTFKSFTMNGLATETSGDSYGLKVSGDTSSAVVEDVKVNDFRARIDFNGLDSLSVKNIEATNARRGHGVALTDVANAVFENVTTSGNIWGGMNISSSGNKPLPGAGTNGVRFLGTNTFGELLPKQYART